jgi:DNA primase large subunit
VHKLQKHKTFRISQSERNPGRKVLVLNLKKEKQNIQKKNKTNEPNLEPELVTALFQKIPGSKDSVPASHLHLESSYLKVPMRDCLRLIENYSIEMVRGFGQANMEISVNILKIIFDRTFMKENQKIKKNLINFTRNNLEFKMMMDSLKKCKMKKLGGEKPTYQVGAGFQKNIRDFDFYAQNHFPLCMYDMYRSFKRDRHLKHNGRLQLILFIKGLGFKVEEVISLFRSIVSKGPASKKIKEYEYMIKHSYGIVGGKTEYSGMGCPKIIANSRPSKGDVHGCPFSYYGDDSLRKLLMHKLNNEKQVDEIVASNSMGAKFGCRKFFCSKNKLLDIEDVDDGIGRHPNIYFNVSYYRKGRKRERRPQENGQGPAQVRQSNKIIPEIENPVPVK